MDMTINQKRKGTLLRSTMYTGLCAFALLSCDSALATVHNPKTINGKVTVHLTLPKGWTARNVNPNGSQTMIAKSGKWTVNYSLPVNTSSGFIPGVNTRAVVFVYDAQGKRQGSFEYGATLRSTGCERADGGQLTSKGSMGVGPLYQNDGAVSFSGYTISPNYNQPATWRDGNGCIYKGHAVVNLKYHFAVG